MLTVKTSMATWCGGEECRHSATVPTTDAAAALPCRNPRTGFCILPSVSRDSCIASHPYEAGAI